MYILQIVHFEMNNNKLEGLTAYDVSWEVAGFLQFQSREEEQVVVNLRIIEFDFQYKS